MAEESLGSLGLEHIDVEETRDLEELSTDCAMLGLAAVDFCEVFNPGRLSAMAAGVGLKAGTVFDLAVGWDADSEQARDWAEKRMEKETPEFLIASPLCTPFSQMQALQDTTTERYQELLQQCMVHLGFVVRLITVQIAAKRFFLFEHPWGAWSWGLVMITALLAMEGVVLVRGDQCPFGQSIIQEDGTDMLIRKRSGWMTNSPRLAVRLGVDCDKLHPHGTLFGRQRAKEAGRYPYRLIRAIL